MEFCRLQFHNRFKIPRDNPLQLGHLQLEVGRNSKQVGPGHQRMGHLTHGMGQIRFHLISELWRQISHNISITQ
jgi:hypothetical protein